MCCISKAAQAAPASTATPGGILASMQKPTRAAAPAAAAAAAAPPAMFPVTAYVQFKAIKVAGLLKKIDEFNAAVPAGMYANLVNSAINASQEFPADAWCGVSTTRSLSLGTCSSC